MSNTVWLQTDKTFQIAAFAGDNTFDDIKQNRKVCENKYFFIFAMFTQLNTENLLKNH